MLKIFIKTIPHKKQRYETLGDYWISKDGTMEIRVSELKNWKEEALIAVHEIIELLLVKDRKISIKEIEKFDIEFEKNKKKKRDEPGDNKKAPYYKEHQFASKIEKMLAKELKVNWKKYENKCWNLHKK